MNPRESPREPMIYEPEPAIRVGVTSREQAETRWGMILVVFMRLLAALWILQGLLQWASFLFPRQAIFDKMPMTHSGAIIYFAVIDLLAAVGLWLATPWGGVLWLLAALSQIIVALTVAHTVNPAWIAADVVLIVLYFALTWQAGRLAAE